ncbi:MAG: phospho-sugar mutase [Mycoplasmataceae bacterium]|nr:phospho-sugar mutase [Mycoplasmataceae bacterium]
MSNTPASPTSIYKDWLNSNKLSKEERRELKKLSKQQIDVQFANKCLTFGTAGVRGVMGLGTTTMNRFVYANLALAYGKYLLKTNKHRPLKIVVGHDNRYNSDFFSLLVAKALSSLGIIVYLYDKNQLMPTPIISFTIRHLKLSGGIIITASHNPKEYNGFKAYRNTGGQVLDTDARMIEKLMVEPNDIINITIKPKTSLIKTIPFSIINDYFKSAKKALINPNWKCSFKSPIVFSGHHGTTCKLIPELLKKFNVNVAPVKEQCFFNHDFVNSPHPNPEDFAAFNLSIKLANKVNSNICLGVDPDGDRLAIAIKHQGKWQLMTGNEMGIIYTYYLLNKYHQKKQPFVVSTHVSTNLIDKIAKDFNAKVYRTSTGFKWIGDIIEQEYNCKHFIVAFEEAIGALVCPINRDKDSFTASLLALEIANDCAKQNMDFVDLLENKIYPKYGHWFGFTDSFVIKSSNWQQELQSKFKFICNYKSKTFGNLTIKTTCFNKNGNCFEWHLDKWSRIKFRISGTEPKFKIYYNLFGNSQQQLKNTYNDLHSKFKKLLGV